MRRMLAGSSAGAAAHALVWGFDNGRSESGERYADMATRRLTTQAKHAWGAGIKERERMERLKTKYRKPTKHAKGRHHALGCCPLKCLSRHTEKRLSSDVINTRSTSGTHPQCRVPRLVRKLLDLRFHPGHQRKLRPRPIMSHG
jgi:hypothetical protein